MNEAYVIYDEANGTYLAGCSIDSLVWERVDNPLFAHIYGTEKTAKMLCNLWQHTEKQTWQNLISHHKNNPNIPKKKPTLIVARISNPTVDLIHR